VVKFEIGSVGFVEGGKPENWRPSEQGENQQQTQLNQHMALGQNQSQATLEWSKHSHQCANP